jgi:hypothetical protein
MGNQGGVINGSSIANGHKIWLCHHWVASVGIETNILPNIRSQKLEIPNQILGATEHIQDPNFAIFPTTKFFKS